MHVPGTHLAAALHMSRRVPGSDEELVEFFLNTMAEDLEFEVARFRPRLTESFFR